MASGLIVRQFFLQIFDNFDCSKLYQTYFLLDVRYKRRLLSNDHIFPFKSFQFKTHIVKTIYSKHISVAENCRINGLGNFIVENSGKKLSSCGVRDLYRDAEKKIRINIQEQKYCQDCRKSCTGQVYFCKRVNLREWKSDKWKNIVTSIGSRGLNLGGMFRAEHLQAGGVRMKSVGRGEAKKP